MKKYAAPSLLLMIVLVAFPQISETIYTPSLPDIAVALGATNSSVQLTLSIYFIGFAIGVFSWGWLSDFIGRRSSMLAGLLVYGMGSLMCFYSESIHLLLVSGLYKRLEQQQVRLLPKPFFVRVSPGINGMLCLPKSRRSLLLLPQ